MLEEIIAENLPNLLKDTNLWIQESEEAPNDKNLKKFLSRYIIIKLQVDGGNDKLPVGQHQF